MEQEKKSKPLITLDRILLLIIFTVLFLQLSSLEKELKATYNAAQVARSIAADAYDAASNAESYASEAADRAAEAAEYAEYCAY
jgi:hypothetical protein